MTVRKLAVSLQEPLFHEIREQADAQRQSVSRWLAEAAERRLRQEHLARFIADYEAEFGVITPEDRAEAEKRWLESL